MRFATAAAVFIPPVLPNSIKGVSASGTDLKSHLHESSVVVGNGNPLVDSVDGQIQRNPILKRRYERNSISTYPMPTATDATLKNEIADHFSMKECDPSSEDPDVGILSCGTSNYCQPIAESKLGGICTAVSRNLAKKGGYYNYNYICYSSNPRFCDCSQFDNATRTGKANCYSINYTCPVGCSDICVSENTTVTFQNGTILLYHGCYYFTKPYKVTFCYWYYPASPDCVYKINGVACNKCNSTYFDCTNIPNGTAGIVNKTSTKHLPLPIMLDYVTINPNSTCAPTMKPAKAPSTSPVASPTTAPHKSAAALPMKKQGPTNGLWISVLGGILLAPFLFG